MKNLVEVFFDVLRRLEEKDIPYMVVGSVAAMVYGEPRLTRDMDLVVDVLPKDVQKLEDLFPADDFYIPPSEVIRAEIVARGQFNLLHQDTGLKIDVIIRKDSPHAKTEFSRRQKVPFWEGHKAFLASPEDVILKKLDYHRQGGSEKHLTDIRGILAETNVNESYMSEWIERLGLQKEWEKLDTSNC